MRVKLSTVLDVPAERVWAEVQTSRLLDFVAWPLQTFEPLDPPALPTTWVEGRYRVRLRLLGLLPIGTQWIVISVLSKDPALYRLRDNGHGSLVSKWDHLISIAPMPGGRTLYTDDVEVRAGILTPAIWMFAMLFYWHRQRRWQKLVALRFPPLEISGAK